MKETEVRRGFAAALEKHCRSTGHAGGTPVAWIYRHDRYHRDQHDLRERAERVNRFVPSVAANYVCRDHCVAAFSGEVEQGGVAVGPSVA